jgi:hypothetical protein
VTSGAGPSSGYRSELVNLVSLCRPAEPPATLRELAVAAAEEAAAAASAAAARDTGEGPDDPHQTPTAHVEGETWSYAGRVLLRRSITVPLIAAVGFALAFLLSATANMLFIGRLSYTPPPAAGVALQEAQVFVLTGSAAAPRARGVAVLGPTEGVIRVTGLSPLTAGYRYVCWASPAARRITAIDVGSGEAGTPVEIVFSMGPGLQPSHVIVTIEPADSPSATPSGPVVLSGDVILPDT